MPGTATGTQQGIPRLAWRLLNAGEIWAYKDVEEETSSAVHHNAPEALRSGKACKLTRYYGDGYIVEVCVCRESSWHGVFGSTCSL